MCNLLIKVLLSGALLSSAISNYNSSGTFAINQKPCHSIGHEGTCMFHYDCQIKRGNIVGSCVDGFLFGVCCEVNSSNSHITNLKPINQLELVDTILSSLNSSLLTLNSNNNSDKEHGGTHAIVVNSGDINHMMSSILENVLSEFETNVDIILNSFVDQMDSKVLLSNLSSLTAGISESKTEEMFTKIKVDNVSVSSTVTAMPLNSTTVSLAEIVNNLTATSEQPIPTTDFEKNAETLPKQFNYKEDCGVRPIRGQGRIVGGEEAKFGDWPWQVLVKESTWLGLFTKNKCGGVLISDKHVLTAAHCQPGFFASLIVELGEFDQTGPTEHMGTMKRKVKQVIVHKDYKAPTFENDIAILELEEAIERKPHIVPICLPSAEDDFEGRTAIVTGWGRLTYGGSVPNILHQVSVPIMNNTKCQTMFTKSGHKKTVRDSFLCAGYDEGTKDSCEGDSGGPLMLQQQDLRWVLVGTVSHGIKCAYPNLPGVYMRMTFYKPWIQKVTGYNLK